MRKASPLAGAISEAAGDEILGLFAKKISKSSFSKAFKRNQNLYGLTASVSEIRTRTS